MTGVRCRTATIRSRRRRTVRECSQWSRPDARPRLRRLILRTGISYGEMTIWRTFSATPRVGHMFTTMLTERRAVDLLRVASSLCRMS
ncbi:putative leader peptide [Nocardioides jiangxiensis]|uniref:putative leader peptide n=1 Tax=Nocardioides jiangxiensis TaxID=3064524 RepID=UPI0034E268EA